MGKKKVSRKRSRSGPGSVRRVVAKVGSGAVAVKAPAVQAKTTSLPSTKHAADTTNGVPSGWSPGALFPVVGIGASAGGLEAFSQLLAQLPPDSGMAFVLIQHLDPTHRSFLTDALRKATTMPVTQVQQGERAEPNHVYVIPPDADVSIQGDLLTLVARSDYAPNLHLPIDFFFTALASERGCQAIGVVLSGTASDGTEGLKAIKAEGGITFAQDPTTAKFAGMPHSAIEAGVVDYTLPVPALAKELVRLSRHPYVAVVQHSKPEKTNDETILNRIMTIVKGIAGVDFKEYKSPTFVRRLARRMALRRVEGREAYLQLLKRDPDEVRALCEDTLIHVSSFFRDPEVFEALKVSVFPEILRHKAPEAPIRLWVAGCATGEEVFSLVICLQEFLGDSPTRPIQVFGSDISEHAIASARGGRYAEGAMKGVSEDRRRRFFTKIDGGFRINKSVRDLCVFARHDLAHAPPFSNVDLLSCRNVLIYFDHALQKRILPSFHYSLNQPGFLLLGRTENISGFAQLFVTVDSVSKIFARSMAPSSLRFVPRSEMHYHQNAGNAADGANFLRRPIDMGRHLDNLLLARYAPPGVLVNEKMEILQFRGQTGSFLQPAPGEPQSNIVKMARGGLLATLRVTLARAKKEMAPVRTEGVEVDQDGFTRTCDLVVIPFVGLPDVKEQLFVVLFEEVGRPAAKSPRGSRQPSPRRQPAPKDALRIPQLEHELSATTEYLHSLIEDQTRTNDDLGSANEELISGNEELQSLNEELETAKEELQSTNEELTTVNDELHSRNLEVGQINSDLINLLDTVDIPVLILDKQRLIRRFTPRARNILNVVPSDVGRLFDDIKPNIEVPDLDRQVSEVIATFVAKESEVQDRDGRWYRMQIRPYKSSNNNVEGAIISLLDIDALKHVLTKAQQATEDAQRADHTKDQFLAVLSHELRTPLSALLMQTQLLRQSGSDTTKRERACQAIERSTRMLGHLIDDLLDVSRIVTGKLRVSLEPVNLVAVVKATMDTMGALAETKGLELRTFLDQSVGTVSGDRTRLEQVVSNLVTNAIKFTPKGGRVDVVLEKVGGLAYLRVSDNGTGIDAEFLPRIFNRLTQGDSSSTRPHGGLGLGLAIVRHLVDAHGGTVRAESPGAGQGATFHVTLPLLHAHASAQSAGESGESTTEAPPDWTRAAGRLKDTRILVVEDDVGTREALAEMFMQVGATVSTAATATEGFAGFSQFRPHVLICDVAMPVEDGYSLIRRIRALTSDRGGNVPAVALTALAGEANRRRALAAGFQIHLAKPVDMNRLADVVVELLDGSQPALTLPTRRDQSSTQ
jgi:signal transduction histidine kinase/chemotaxis methyl-accepting protein methylase/chemotaxis response regulator CheB